MWETFKRQVLGRSKKKKKQSKTTIAYYNGRPFLKIINGRVHILQKKKPR